MRTRSPPVTRAVSRRLRCRAYLYLTRVKDVQLQVAVFRHPDFETMALPYQVPGGTIEPDETPEAGALREAVEESGFTAFSAVRLLARDTWYGVHDSAYRERYFYQFRTNGVTSDTWNHTVTDGELDKGMVFAYRWLSVKEAQSVIGHMGDYLHLLK